MSSYHPYIGPVKIDYENDTMLIPFIDGSRYCVFDLKEDWCIEDFIKNNSSDGTISLYSGFEVYGEDDEEDLKIEAYEIIDKSGEQYFLVTTSYFTQEDFSMTINAVCIPANYFSLLRFYREYILPFAGKRFFRG